MAIIDRAETAAERSVQRSREQATPGDDGLVYRRQENARLDSGGSPAASALLAGDDGKGDACEVPEFDADLLLLAEAVAEFVGETCVEVERKWEADDDKLLARINGLQDRLKTLSARHRHAKLRIANLEQQVATLGRRIGDLEKAVPAARLAEFEGKVKSLSEAIAGEPLVRDLDSRVSYLEALLPMMIPMPRRLGA